MKVSISRRFYRGCFRVARVLFGIFLWQKAIGKENIPDGAAIVCANHSSFIDPILMLLALGIDCPARVIAKAELFKVPILSAVIRKLGAISVDRGTLDVASTRATLGCLKNGEKVAIFPEGTRSAEDGMVAAKKGAIKLAEHANVPLLPVYIPRKKPKFRKFAIVIGKPYYIEQSEAKRSAEQYTVLADSMMSGIAALNPAAAPAGIKA